MKKVLICGMLLGLLPSLAFAQRGRMAGGIGPSSRTTMPSTIGPMSSTARINSNPGASTLGHGKVAPSTKPVGSVTTVKPSTVNGKTADSVGMTTKTVPDRDIPPDTGTVRPDSGVGPDR